MPFWLGGKQDVICMWWLHADAQIRSFLTRCSSFAYWQTSCNKLWHTCRGTQNTNKVNSWAPGQRSFPGKWQMRSWRLKWIKNYSTFKKHKVNNQGKTLTSKEARRKGKKLWNPLFYPLKFMYSQSTIFCLKVNYLSVNTCSLPPPKSLLKHSS